MRVLETLTKLVTCCMVCTTALQLDSTWSLDSRFKDLITNNCLLDTFSGITLINCASMCFKRNQCMSFFYVKSSQTCNHHAAKFEKDPTNNNTFMKQTGAVYFYNDAEDLQNMSTSCAADKCTKFTYLPSVNAYFKMAQNSTSSRQAASDLCIANGGTLAAPRDKTTIDAIESMIHTSMRGVENLKGFWVSAKYNRTVNDFVWPDDSSTISSSLWHPGKPEYFRTAGAKTDCVVLVPLYKFKFSDYLCNTSGDYVIPLCQCN